MSVVLPNPVIPPSTKIAASAAASAQPATTADTTQTPPAQSAQTDATTQQPAAKEPQKKRDFAKETSDRIAKAIEDDRAKQREGAKEPDKAASTDKQPATGPADDSDDALKRELETSTQGLDPKAKAGFTKLRYENRDLSRKLKESEAAIAEAAELKKQLAELQAQAGKTAPAASSEELTKLKADLEAANARLNEKEQELLVGRLEATDEFKLAVTAPLNGVKSAVTKLAAKYKDKGLNEKALLEAVLDTGNENQGDTLAEMGAVMNQFDMSVLVRQVEAVRDIQGKEATLRANSAAALERINSRTQQETVAQREARVAAFKDAAGKSWDEMAKVAPVISPAEGEDEVTKNWNGALAQARQFAEQTDFTTLDAPTQAGVLHRAAVHGLLVGTVNALQQELATAYDKLSKYEASKPGAETTTSTTKVDPHKGKDWADRVSARIAEITPGRP